MKKLYCLLIFSLLLPGAFLAADSKKDAKGKAEVTPTPEIEFTCESEIFFVWRLNPPRNKDSKNPVKTERLPISKEFYARVGETGTSETETKSRLSASLVRIQAEALTECDVLHQNRAACISRKLKKISGDTERMDFGMRRAVNESVAKDCELAMGTCLSAEATPVRCVASGEAPVAPTVAPTPTPRAVQPQENAPTEEEVNRPSSNPYNVPFSIE